MRLKVQIEVAEHITSIGQVKAFLYFMIIDMKCIDFHIAVPISACDNVNGKPLFSRDEIEQLEITRKECLKLCVNAEIDMNALINEVHDKNKVRRVSMRLPKMETKKVWIGTYFNHYNAVLIFNKEPKFSDDSHDHIDGKWIDVMDDYNKSIVAGNMGLEEFRDVFPDFDFNLIVDKETGNVKELEPTELHEVYLTAMWNADKLIGIDFNLDGYQTY